MNKSIAIQQNKLFTSYGGVGSMIDTIDDLSLTIAPFDQWNRLYDAVCIGRELHYQRLQLKEARLCSRIRDLGFESLEGFFRADTSFDEEKNFKAYCPENTFTERMVRTKYFPRWFYCPKCHRFMPYEGWRHLWGNSDDFESHAPACKTCQSPRLKRPRLMQTRFVMASMESGEIRDIPWDLVFHKGDSDSDNAPVWVFNEHSKQSKEVYFYISDASTNLSRIYIKNEDGIKVLLSTIFRHYIVMVEDGKQTVYKPLVRSENNIYYNYNLNSIYIPLPVIDTNIVAKIREYHNEGDNNRDIQKDLKRHEGIDLTIDQIQSIIDGADDINPKYESEAQFRKEEFDFITDRTKYDSKDSYSDREGRLKSYIYSFSGSKPSFIKNVYYQTALNVTTVQIAYSRIDKIGLDHIKNWKGQNIPGKKWYDPVNDRIAEVDVALKPTCQGDKSSIKRMPAMSAVGEGMMFELDLSLIDLAERHIFMHTFCHMLMKELEFVCGYPIASMNERLYAFEDDGKYGFLIYAVGGSSGSYGGLSSLFISNEIESIISNCLERAKDCSNDPICSSEGGSCFACVQIPETTCEMFNNGISRNVFNKYA